jgi:peptidoglycan/LPS O-acetylase OafA/YrhL
MVFLEFAPMGLREFPVAVPTKPRAENSARISMLDGIRALAISLVLCAHGIESPLADAMGSLGVNLFFVLSGFLITSLLLKEHERTGRINLLAFYGRRVRRIFPAYYVYLAVIFIATVIGLTQVDVRAFIYDVLYLRNYSFGVPGDWWTGHSWTLCIEEQFYLIWPFLLVLGGKRFGWWFAGACIILAPAVRVLTYVRLPAYRDFIDVMLPTRIDMIMFGCALALAAVGTGGIVAKISQRGLAYAVAILAAAVIAGLFLTVRFHGLYAFTIGYTVTGFACAAFLHYVVRYPTTLVAKLLSLSPVTWLGRISYSLYLWQQPFLTPGLNQTITGRFPFNLVTAVVIATASYYLIERRFFVPIPLRSDSAIAGTIT